MPDLLTLTFEIEFKYSSMCDVREIYIWIYFGAGSDVGAKTDDWIEILALFDRCVRYWLPFGILRCHATPMYEFVPLFHTRLTITHRTVLAGISCIRRTASFFAVLLSVASMCGSACLSGSGRIAIIAHFNISHIHEDANCTLHRQHGPGRQTQHCLYNTNGVPTERQ